MVIRGGRTVGPHLLARPHVLVLRSNGGLGGGVGSLHGTGVRLALLALPLLVLWPICTAAWCWRSALIGPVVVEALVTTAPRMPRVLMRWLPFTALACF